MENLHEVSIKIDITLSAPAQLVHVFNWFKKIQLQTVNGEPIRTWFSDSMLLSLGSTTSDAQFSCSAKDLNIETKAPMMLGLRPTLGAGSYTFTLPLRSALWEDGLPWANAAQDLNIVVTPDDSGIVASGAGVPTCTALGLMLEGDSRPDAIGQTLDQIAKTTAICKYFCEPVPVTKSVVISAGTNLISLQGISGKVSMLQLLIRPQGISNVQGGRLQWMNFGDNSGATMDLLDSSSTSLLGGTPVPTKYLRNSSYVQHFGNSFAHHKPLYVLPLGDIVSLNFKGVFKGYQQFDVGVNYQLALNCVAPVQEVQTLTPVGATASVAGNYQFYFRGEYSTALGLAATTAQMQTAIANMRVMKKNNITAVVSGSMNAATSALPITVTFSTPETAGLEGDLLQVIGDLTITGGGSNAVPTTITTYGRDGIVPGTYDISIYAYTIRSASFARGVVRTQLV